MIEPVNAEAGSIPASSAALPIQAPDPEAAGAWLRADGAPVIELRGITRVYSTGRLEVTALRGVDLDVYAGDFLAIVGPSGSGKSTLMNIIGCLDRPTGGSYHLARTSVEMLDDDDLARVRGRAIGFVFQSFNLLPRTTALENVATPLLYQGVPRHERMERARAALERLGLGDRMDHEPSQLSGGQQQRVAIARALVNHPPLIFADEPTGNLDSRTSEEVLSMFEQLNAQDGITIIIVTHDALVAKHARQIIRLHDGLVVERAYGAAAETTTPPAEPGAAR